MKKTGLVPNVSAMGFYHQDGFVAAWRQAARFAGRGGRLATMPDVTDIRLATKPGDPPWETYYTTLTGEYLGFSRGGTRILIVAHGVGPLATLDGITAAYAHEYKDKARTNNGGRIPIEEFRRLENGAYGDVDVIDFEALLARYEYALLEALRASVALREPLLRARLGPRAEEYITFFARQAQRYHRERGDGHVDDPFILHLEGPSNCSYVTSVVSGGTRNQLDDQSAFAHLVSVGSLANVGLSGREYPQYPCLMHDIGCFEWWNGVRLIGIRSGTGSLKGLSQGPDVYGLVQRHWQRLLRNIAPASSLGLRRLFLMQDGEYFTRYPKCGDGLDTCDPEFRITSLEPVGDPVPFETVIGGYHGLFKYGVSEVQAIAPAGANVYDLAGEPQIIANGARHFVPIQFYRAEIDTARRLPTAKELSYEYSTLMELLAIEEGAA